MYLPSSVFFVEYTRTVYLFCEKNTKLWHETEEEMGKDWSLLNILVLVNPNHVPFIQYNILNYHVNLSMTSPRILHVPKYNYST